MPLQSGDNSVPQSEGSLLTSDSAHCAEDTVVPWFLAGRGNLGLEAYLGRVQWNRAKFTEHSSDRRISTAAEEIGCLTFSVSFFELHVLRFKLCLSVFKFDLLI